MYSLSNKDRKEIITLLSALKERDKFIPKSIKSIKDANITRRANLLIRKLNSKKH